MMGIAIWADREEEDWRTYWNDVLAYLNVRYEWEDAR